ncbi:MAG: BON domain-containing protein [Acidobacteriota bacterium]|nr:BON domain-containing protein [Acidobacteriota bacterium]
MKHLTTTPLAAGMGGLVLALSAILAPRPAVAATSDAQAQAEVQKALDHKRLKNVAATVQNGTVTLTGTVDLYSDKDYADKRVHHAKGVKAVDNEIQVQGPTVDDLALRNKLANQLATDRVGYGTTAFNAITIGVQNGVVTLGGTVYGPPDKDSALSLVENTPGVKDVIDNLDVAPLSPMDDQLRLQLARVIYGTPQLQKYALDPAKPIRITVVNGNVTLSGVVDNQGDKDVANIRANSVPNVFKVTNNLQVEGSSQRGR